MWKPAGLLLVACALLVSFLVHDHEAHRGIVVEDVVSAGASIAPRAVAAKAETAAPLPKLAAPDAAPVDKVARAKFPKADRKLVDLVAYVNSFVNSRMTGVDDKEHYGVDDYWVQAPEDGAGDCEDYALTKILALSVLDLEDPAMLKLVLVVVHEKKADEGEGHAILAFRFPSGEVAYLDNNYDELMTRKELKRAGYQFFDWRA